MKRARDERDARPSATTSGTTAGRGAPADDPRPALLRRVVAGRKVLDLGCNTARSPRDRPLRAMPVLGVDVDAALVARARARGRCARAARAAADAGGSAGTGGGPARAARPTRRRGLAASRGRRSGTPQPVVRGRASPPRPGRRRGRRGRRRRRRSPPDAGAAIDGDAALQGRRRRRRRRRRPHGDHRATSCAFSITAGAPRARRRGRCAFHGDGGCALAAACVRRSRRPDQAVGRDAGGARAHFEAIRVPRPVRARAALGRGRLLDVDASAYRTARARRVFNARVGSRRFKKFHCVRYRPPEAHRAANLLSAFRRPSVLPGDRRNRPPWHTLAPCCS